MGNHKPCVCNLNASNPQWRLGLSCAKHCIYIYILRDSSWLEGLTDKKAEGYRKKVNKHKSSKMS